MTLGALLGAFAAAGFVALTATPLARRLALRWHFLDLPGAHKGHAAPVPYLGGVAIMVATLAAATLGHALNPTTGRILLVATVLGAVGLVDDSRPIGVVSRLVCQLLGAALILGAGLRFQLTGSPVVDGAISLVWIVGVTNAFNLLDNMDGLSAGVAALAGLAVAGTALAGGRPDLALIAMALVGACLGFLAFNLNPATIFMGDAGSMFLGAMVAALTLAAHPPGSAAKRLAVPLLIVALPLLDTATVVFGRARRRLPVMEGGRDHLSHRLVRLGLRSRNAVRVLLLVEALSAALAFLLARGVVEPWVGLAMASVPLVALEVVTIRPRVYHGPVRGLPRWLPQAATGAILVLALLSAPAVEGMLRARSHLEAGNAALQRGLDDEQAGAAAQAGAELAAARADFGAGRHDLAAPGVSLGRVVPLVAVNLKAARTVADIGWDLSGAGGQLANISAIDSTTVSGNTVDLASMQRLAPALASLSTRLHTDAGQVQDLPLTLLLSPFHRDVVTLEARLSMAAGSAGQLANAAVMVPDLLGAKGPRRYLVLVQDSAEARATGGVALSYGVLQANQGQLTVGPFGRLASLDAPAGTDRTSTAPADYLSRYSRFAPFDLWQNLNMSPDFPTVAGIAADLYPQSGGGPVDGVIGVDPEALADLLAVTGPVQVPGWSLPITTLNVVPVTTEEDDDAVSGSQSAGLLGAVTEDALSALGEAHLPALRLLQALDPAVTGRHLQVYFVDPKLEALAENLGASGTVTPVAGDQLLVTTQNGSADQVDAYLQRSISYALVLSPASSALEGPDTVTVTGTVTVTLENGAPSSGWPVGAIGPAAPYLEPGENRTFMSLYTPLTVVDASVAGTRIPLESGVELGQNVVSTFVEVPAGGTLTVVFRVGGTIGLAAGGWYTLDLPQQPVLNPDRLSVSLSVSPGWALSTEDGSAATRSASVSVAVTGEEALRVQILREGADRWLSPVPSAATGS